MLSVSGLLSRLDVLYDSGDRAAMEAFLEKHIAEAEAEQNEGALLALYNEQQGFLRTGGRAAEAAAVTVKALNLIEKLGLTDTKNHAATLINAGTAHAMAGKPEEAIGYFQKAEALLSSLGEGGYTLAALYNNISHALDALHRPAEAAEYLEKALGIIETVPDAEDAAATTKAGLGAALMRLGRYEAAETYINSALAYYESEAGASDPHHCSAYCTAAELLYRKGQYAESVRLYEKALALIAAIYGVNDAYRITERNLNAARKKAGVI